MKNNVLKLLSLALIVPMVTACPKKNNTPVPEPIPVPVTEWDEEIQEQMEYYCGEVLPFAELNLETLKYGYDEDYSEFCMEDVNEENALENYAEALIAEGFVETTNETFLGSYISYDKKNEIGKISVTFGYLEASEASEAGNYFYVVVPEFISDELLVEYGYELSEGWPTQLVADTMDGSGYTITPVNEEGNWYFASEVEQGDDGYWNVAYLATEGKFVDEFGASLLEDGCAYYEDYDCYYDPTGASDFFISAYEARGYTLIVIEGPTFVPTLDYQGDALDQAAFGLTDGVSSYGNHTATGASGATYSAQCASSHGIQIRSKNSTSGILGTNTEKTCESITVLFDNNTQSGRTINVYGSDEAFTIGDMYGSMTPVGTIVYGENAIVSYEFTAEYNYIGLRSADGAIYISGIDVVWSD